MGKETLIFNFFLGECKHMQTVQITVTLNINPATPPPPPLAANPATVSLPDETVGVAVANVPVSAVTGGTPPFTVALDPSSPSPLPPGLTASIDASGAVTVSGTPEAAGSGTFVLAVSDSGA